MTDRIHVEDITQNSTPHGLLDDDTRARFDAWPHGVAYLACDGTWVDIDYPSWAPSLTYRALPAPVEMPTVDWSHVGPGINHFAAHETEVVMGFERMPTSNLGFWKCNTGFAVARADLIFASYRRGNVHWDKSLISRPEADK